MELISDIEAWLSSLSIRARPKAWSFIRENLVSIHHCPAIHAKAVISTKLAIFGSANLTNTGILNRTEMGILIDEPLLVAEIGSWFEILWQQTLPPIADETSAYIQWLDEESERTPTRREKFSLSASSRKILSVLVNRLGRAIDRARVPHTMNDDQRAKHVDEFEIIVRRTAWIREGVLNFV